jgi:long-chain acyl-CoA synthetase
MEKVAENLSEVSPTVVVCVPRFFEKMYNGVIQKVKSGSSIKQKLFWWAINIGKDYVVLNNLNKKLPFLLKMKHALANKLIYSKIKEKIGKNIKFFISGGAPLSVDVAEFFASLNITILEGYGLTETSPVLTSNTPNAIKFGYVGKPLNNVKLQIANDGEILAKGPNIMLGYYNDKVATDEVLDNEGWLHTGDIGIIDDDGYLKITDRKKSLIVTSGGKNIAPAPLENSLLSSSYIDQVVVIGDKRNFLSCLIVPSFTNVKEFLNNLGKDIDSNEAMIDYPDVLELFNKELDLAMSDFSKYEQIKKFMLLSRNFMIEKGEMTPKMSIVRKVVESNFKDKIEEIYKDTIV